LPKKGNHSVGVTPQQAHRAALEDHVTRATNLGRSRSDNLRIGITWRSAQARPLRTDCNWYPGRR
jgi:hypothetical protein